MRRLTGYVKPIVALAVTPDGKRLFSVADGQSKAWEWDLASGTVTRKLDCRGGPWVLAMSPTGGYFVWGGPYGFGHWPLAGSEEPRYFSPNDQAHDFAQLGDSADVALHPTRRLVAGTYFRKRWGERTSTHGFMTWDIDTGDLTIHPGHEGLVEGIAYSPDGEVVATASRDGTVRLWAGDSVEVLPVRVIPSRVAFRPDGGALAAAGAKSVFVFDISGRKVVAGPKELKGQAGNIKALAYSPDGRYLASAGLDGVVVLRDALTNEVAGQLHLDIGKIGVLCWLPDSGGIVAGGEKHIGVCELSELLGAARTKGPGEPLSLAGSGLRVDTLAYSRDGQALACCDSAGQVRIWDLSRGAGQASEKVSFHLDRMATVLSWSADGLRLAVTFPSAAQVHDTRTGQVVSLGRKGGADRILYLPSGRLFLLTQGSRTRPPQLELRGPDGEETVGSKSLEGEGHLSQACAGPGERHLYFVWGLSAVYRWSPDTGEVACVARQKAEVVGLAVAADERLLLTRGGNTATLWSLPEGKKKAELKHPALCNGAEFIPGGRVLTACNDGVVRVWDPSTAAELQAFELGMGKVFSLAVSPDHMTFAAAVHKNRRIVLMDLPE